MDQNQSAITVLLGKNGKILIILVAFLIDILFRGIQKKEIITPGLQVLLKPKGIAKALSSHLDLQNSIQKLLNEVWNIEPLISRSPAATHQRVFLSIGFLFFLI